MQTNNFGFGNTTGFFLQLACFCPFWAHNQDILGVRLRLNNFIVTYLCRLSTLVLKVQPYLIVLIWSQLGYFLHILVLLGLFFGLGWGPKRFLTPINVDYQFWFWNYSPIFFFHWAPFGPFGAIFGVRVKSQNFFGTYLHSLATFVLEVCGFYSSFILFWGIS